MQTISTDVKKKENCFIQRIIKDVISKKITLVTYYYWRVTNIECIIIIFRMYMQPHKFTQGLSFDSKFMKAMHHFSFQFKSL